MSKSSTVSYQQKSSRKGEARDIQTRIENSLKTRSVNSNLALKIDLNSYLELDELFWNCIQGVKISEAQSTLAKYLDLASKLSIVPKLFPDEATQILVEKTRTFEEYFMCFFLQFNTEEYLRASNFNLKAIVRYISKNFIMLLEDIVEHCQTIYRSNPLFARLLRLVSKRKIFFEIPQNLSAEKKTAIIGKNFKFVKTIILTEAKDYSFLVDEVSAFAKETDLSLP